MTPQPNHYFGIFIVAEQADEIGKIFKESKVIHWELCTLTAINNGEHMGIAIEWENMT